MLQAQVMAGGVAGPAAAAIAGTNQVGQTALGSTQANAFPLAAANTSFSTVAASTGAVLPTNAQVGDLMEIYNGGANSLTVYPALGGTINNLGANTGLAIATLKSGFFRCNGSIAGVATWYSFLSA